MKGFTQNVYLNSQSYIGNVESCQPPYLGTMVFYALALGCCAEVPSRLDYLNWRLSL